MTHRSLRAWHDSRRPPFHPSQENRGLQDRVLSSQFPGPSSQSPDPRSLIPDPRSPIPILKRPSPSPQSRAPSPQFTARTIVHDDPCRGARAGRLRAHPHERQSIFSWRRRSSYRGLGRARFRHRPRNPVVSRRSATRRRCGHCLVRVSVFRRSRGVQTRLGRGVGRRRVGLSDRQQTLLRRHLSRTGFPSRPRGSTNAFPDRPTGCFNRALAPLPLGVQQHVVRQLPTVISRYTQGEILYVIDKEASDRAGLPIVQALWRIRKKNGEWGKPQPAAVGLNEVEQLSDEADRNILPLLLGATDANELLGSYTSVYSRTSFQLHGALADRLLPMLAQSGRLHVRQPVGADGASGDRRSERRASELEALTWDDGPPWDFHLDMAIQDDGRDSCGRRIRSRWRADERKNQPFCSRAGFSWRTPCPADAIRGHFRLDARIAAVRADARAGSQSTAHLLETMAQSNVDPAALPDRALRRHRRGRPGPGSACARSAKPQGLRHPRRSRRHGPVRYAGSVVAARPESARL